MVLLLRSRVVGEVKASTIFVAALPAPKAVEATEVPIPSMAEPAPNMVVAAEDPAPRTDFIFAWTVDAFLVLSALV